MLQHRVQSLGRRFGGDHQNEIQSSKKATTTVTVLAILSPDIFPRFSKSLSYWLRNKPGVVHQMENPRVPLLEDFGLGLRVLGP